MKKAPPAAAIRSMVTHKDTSYNEPRGAITKAKPMDKNIEATHPPQADLLDSATLPVASPHCRRSGPYSDLA